MESGAHNKKQPVIRKLATLAIVVATAWLLGQFIAPVLLKALFL